MQNEPLPFDVDKVPRVELGDRVEVRTMAGNYTGTVTGTARDMMGFRRAHVRLDDGLGVVDVATTSLRQLPCA